MRFLAFCLTKRGPACYNKDAGRLCRSASKVGAVSLGRVQRRPFPFVPDPSGIVALFKFSFSPLNHSSRCAPRANKAHKVAVLTALRAKWLPSAIACDYGLRPPQKSMRIAAPLSAAPVLHVIIIAHFCALVNTFPHFCFINETKSRSYAAHRAR